jgi:carbon-monoxide dehydrogenase large subunit
VREALAGRYIGASQRRREDQRLLTGRGRYVDDVMVPGMAHAAFLRSPIAHGSIVSIDTDEARRLDGVIGILTGADIAKMTNAFAVPVVFKTIVLPTFHALAVDRVRHVGDPVAIVVAESRAIAEDACELIDVRYEQMDAIPDSHAALTGGAAVWSEAPDNVLLNRSEDDGDVDSAFGSADRLVRNIFHLHRHSNQPMETRGIVAELDSRTGHVTVHSNTQNLHMLKWSLAMLVNRQTVRASLLALARNRQRMSAFGRGTADYVKARPELAGIAKLSMPVFASHAIRNPRWVRELMRAMLNLLATPSVDLPTVRTADIGGAFGSKSVVPREDVAVLAAARHFGRSIKWIEDRNEHLTVGSQARDESVDVEMAVDRDGNILGAKVRLLLDAGAYPAFPFGAPVFARIGKLVFPGPYRIGALRFETTLVATNKATYVAYRGPWAFETWVRERMIDMIAREVGRPAAEVRHANMYGPKDLPTPMVTGPVLDTRMSARATLERAMAVADVDNWPKVQESERIKGRIRGMGIATFLEPAPGPPGFTDFISPGFNTLSGPEPIAVALEHDGMVRVYTQQVPHGQGQETAYAQVAADRLGLPIECIEVRFGDTDYTPFSLLGTSGSKGSARAGGAVFVAAGELRERIDSVAADMLEVGVNGLVRDGAFIHVTDATDVRVHLHEIVAEAARRGLGTDTAALEVRCEWDCGPGGWAQATHVCWVDVDLETGRVTIPRYVVVEDSGHLINPAIVDGQIRGGVTQGIGAVFYERSFYDEDGQVQTGTFKDYLIPTSAEIPDFEIHHVQTPTDVPANFRGVGEGGMICSPAAITNAVEDALAHLGVQITEQHLPPSRILELAGVIPTTSEPHRPLASVTRSRQRRAKRRMLTAPAGGAALLAAAVGVRVWQRQLNRH